MTSDVNSVRAVFPVDFYMRQAGTPILVPCSLINRVPAAFETRSRRIMKTARGPVELPVAGSSGMPYSGANIREWAPSEVGVNTKTQKDSLSLSFRLLRPVRSSDARSTAALSLTATTTVGFRRSASAVPPQADRAAPVQALSHRESRLGTALRGSQVYATRSARCTCLDSERYPAELFFEQELVAAARYDSFLQ